MRLVSGSSRSKVTVEVHGLTRLMFQMAVVAWGLVMVLILIAAFLGEFRASATTNWPCRDATIVGTPKADFLVGTSGRDIIRGRGGDDTILGLDGNDVLCGNRGRDSLRGGEGIDFAFGAGGTDRCFAEKRIRC